MSCIYKYKGKDYTKDEFYSLVATIRQKIKDGVKGSMIALEYNVSKYCISLIKNNKTYSHVS